MAALHCICGNNVTKLVSKSRELLLHIEMVLDNHISLTLSVHAREGYSSCPVCLLRSDFGEY